MPESQVLLRQLDRHLAALRRHGDPADVALAEELAAALRRLVSETTFASAADRAKVRAAHVAAMDIGVLALEALLAVAVGATRGATIHLYRRDGQLWQRYRWSTLAVWIAAIALRAGLVVGGRLADVHVATKSLVLILGISLVAESALVSWRAARTGVPLAPSRRRISV